MRNAVYGFRWRQLTTGLLHPEDSSPPPVFWAVFTRPCPVWKKKYCPWSRGDSPASYSHYFLCTLWKIPFPSLWHNLNLFAHYFHKMWDYFNHFCLFFNFRMRIKMNIKPHTRDKHIIQLQPRVWRRWLNIWSSSYSGGEMALYDIIISVYEPPGNVSPSSPSHSSEGELQVLFLLFMPLILSLSSSLLMAVCLSGKPSRRFRCESVCIIYVWYLDRHRGGERMQTQAGELGGGFDSRQNSL